MRFLQISLAFLVLLALAACSGGGGAFGGFDTDTLTSQATYSEGPSDTASASLSDDGIAGALAVAPGIGSSAALQSIKVRASVDYQTIYVSINGGAEFALAATFPSDANGGGYGPTGVNSNYLSLSNLGETSLLGRTVDSSGGFGYAGVMTPVANLPSANATYTGTWSGWVNPGSISDLTSGTGGGDMTLTLNVASGSMDGTFSGSMNIGDFSGSAVYPISGVVDATATDGVLAGTFTANSGVYQGSADMGGAFYGFNGETVAGAMAGSLNGGSGNHPFYGLFDLEPD